MAKKIKIQRTTKAYSFERSQEKWFKMVDREAAKRRPKVTNSQMMVEIIRTFFEHKKIVDDLNRKSLESTVSAQ